MTPDRMAAIHAAAFTRSRAWSAEEFARLLDNPTTGFATRPDGFILWRCIACEAELLTIAVNPMAQGKGVGQALMTAMSSALAGQADALFLEVAEDNFPALALYEKCGLTEVGRRKAYYRRPGSAAVDAVLMQATLPLGQACESRDTAPKNG